MLISLYNLQDLLEDPFDQMGLDDIKLDEFEFLEPPREHAEPRERLIGGGLSDDLCPHTIRGCSGKVVRTVRRLGSQQPDRDGE